jgi:hypothetical protein
MVRTLSPARRVSTAADPVSISIRVPDAKQATCTVLPLAMLKPDAATAEPKMI